MPRTPGETPAAKAGGRASGPQVFREVRSAMNHRFYVRGCAHEEAAALRLAQPPTTRRRNHGRRQPPNSLPSESAAGAEAPRRHAVLCWVVPYHNSPSHRLDPTGRASFLCASAAPHRRRRGERDLWQTSAGPAPGAAGLRLRTRARCCHAVGGARDSSPRPDAPPEPEEFGCAAQRSEAPRRPPGRCTGWWRRWWECGSCATARAPRTRTGDRRSGSGFHPPEAIARPGSGVGQATIAGGIGNNPRTRSLST